MSPAFDKLNPNSEGNVGIEIELTSLVNSIGEIVYKHQRFCRQEFQVIKPLMNYPSVFNGVIELIFNWTYMSLITLPVS